MSNLILNLRIFYWSFQIDNKYKFSLRKSRYWYDNKLESFKSPFAIYDFNLVELLKLGVRRK